MHVNVSALRNPNDFMVKRQADIISSLREQAKKLEKENDRLIVENERLSLAADFWFMLQKQILSNPDTLGAAWDDFIFHLTLHTSEDDFKKYEKIKHDCI